MNLEGLPILLWENTYKRNFFLPMTVFFLESTKTMIWIWKFGDQILALNERPYDAAASR